MVSCSKIAKVHLIQGEFGDLTVENAVLLGNA